MIDRRLKKLPMIPTVLYILFLLAASMDAFSTGEPVVKQVGWFLLYNLPGLLLLLFLLFCWEKLLFCGEIFLLLAGLLSLVFLPWEQPVSWLLLVFPIFLTGIFYLLLYYWEKHYKMFS